MSTDTQPFTYAKPEYAYSIRQTLEPEVAAPILELTEQLQAEYAKWGGGKAVPVYLTPVFQKQIVLLAAQIVADADRFGTLGDFMPKGGSR